jgi:hypothetical protein
LSPLAAFLVGLIISAHSPLLSAEDEERESSVGHDGSSARATVDIDPDTGRPLPRKPFGWRQAVYDTRYLVRRPAHIGKKERNQLLAIGGGTVLLYALREELRDWVQETKSEDRTEFLDTVHTMGTASFAPTLALISYSASFVTKNPREKETAVMLLESAAYSAVLAGAGSFVLAAERPEDGDSVTFFDVDGHGVSLDAALAASIIPPLSCQYLRVKPDDSGAVRFGKRASLALLYTGAALTAFQRMDADKHWAPDVFLGIESGLFVGSSICQAHEEVRQKKSQHQETFSLLIAPRAAGVIWSRRW